MAEELPAGHEWPAYMVGDDPLLERLRATYARITWRVHAEIAERNERVAALDWCRANGNPHTRTGDPA